MSERRLLVVDDEPDFAEFVSNAAGELGYETRVCTQPKEFRRIYAEPVKILTKPVRLADLRAELAL